jgi:hypothetical protein
VARIETEKLFWSTVTLKRVQGEKTEDYRHEFGYCSVKFTARLATLASFGAIATKGVTNGVGGLGVVAKRGPGYPITIQSYTCWKRADTPHGRNESSVLIVIAHTKLEGK